MKILLLVPMLLFFIGCDDQVSPNVQKDTGFVTISGDGYVYHKTLQFPDGRNVEFYACNPVLQGLTDGEVVQIIYQGDGSSVHNCATNVSFYYKPNTHNEQGQKFHSGTKIVYGWTGIKEMQWINQDHTECGTVYFNDPQWAAFAIGDLAGTHYYQTQKEAIKWLTDNWCKP